MLGLLQGRPHPGAWGLARPVAASEVTAAGAGPGGRGVVLGRGLATGRGPPAGPGPGHPGFRLFL